MSTGADTTFRTALPDRGRIVLPRRRLAPGDWVALVMPVVAAAALWFVLQSWVLPVLYAAIMIQTVLERVASRVVITDEELVQDQWVRRLRIPLSAVRGATFRDGQVVVAVELDARNDGRSTKAAVPIGPWSRRVVGADPLAYADSLARLVRERAERLEPATVHDVRPRQTWLGWTFLVGGLVAVAVFIFLTWG